MDYYSLLWESLPRTCKTIKTSREKVTISSLLPTSLIHYVFPIFYRTISSYSLILPRHLFFSVAFLSFLLPSFLSSFYPSFLPSLLPSFLASFLHSFLHSFFASFLASFLPSFLPSILPSCLTSFLPLFVSFFCL